MVCNQRLQGEGGYCTPPLFAEHQSLRRLHGLAPIRLKAGWRCWKWMTNRYSALFSNLQYVLVQFWQFKWLLVVGGNAGRDRKQSLIHLCRILIDICRYGMRVNGFSKLTMNHCTRRHQVKEESPTEKH